MKKIIKTIIIICLLGVGFVAGIFVKHIPGITLKHEIGLSDIVNFFVVILIAIIMPLVFNQWQDNKRCIKNFLIDEIKSIIKELEKIKDIIDGCAIKGQTTDVNKKSVNMHLRCLDNKINSLGAQIDISFKKPGCNLKDKLVSECLKYWKETTGGDLMSEKFSIDQNFCRIHDIAFYAFQTELKKAVHSVNDF